MSCADRISSLPNEIILHILSFLPTTKLRAQTSVLAKRWREIWTHFPSLHISVTASGGGDDIAGAHYANAVAACILSFKPPSHHKLSADLWPPSSSETALLSRLLLQFAGLRHVRKLRIHAICGAIPNWFSPVPDSLYFCTSLVHLKITLGVFPAVTAGFNGFRALKSLYLDIVTIDTHNLAYLLDGCDRLETITIVGCWGFDYFAVDPLNLPRITDLAIRSCHELTRATIEAAHLKSIVYEGDLACLELSVSQVLHEAALRQSILKPCLDSQEQFTTLLFSLQNASVLTANSWFYQFVISKRGVLPNLKELTLYMDKQGWVAKVLITNIRECPMLETLNIHFLYVQRWCAFFNVVKDTPMSRTYKDALLAFSDENDEQDWSNLPDGVPRHSLLQLKTVVLTEFAGTKNHMLLVKFLLGNGVALEKLFVFDALERSKEELEELFASIPRASPQVELKLSLSENWKLKKYSQRHVYLFKQ